MNATHRIGWYSREQERIMVIFGQPVCLCLDKDGRRVEATEVKSDESPSRFSDAICVGEVTEFVGHRTSTLDSW